MTKTNETPIRCIRIDNKVWRKLTKMAKPKKVSSLARKVLTDYVNKDDQAPEKESGNRP